MRTQSLILCSYSIIISLIHLVIFFSLFYPLGHDGTLWQMIFPSWSDLLRAGLLSFVFIVLLSGTLVFPPLASWVAFRFPVRMMSLVGVWISLCLTLVAGLFFSGLFWSPPALYSDGSSVLGLSLADLVFRIPLFGFGLSFILCLVLAIRLPLIRAHEQAALRVSWLEGLASIREASRERAHISEEETRPSRAGKDFRLPLFAFLGLLCHLLIFLSLFFTYIDYYDPYGDTVLPTPTTGWQLLAQAFQPQTSPRAAIMPPLPAPLAIVLLTTLILPALIYLACLVLWPVKSELKDTRLRKSVYVCYLLNLIGLSLSSFYVMFSWLSHGGDLHDPVQDTSLAFAIPPIAFLLSLACSYLLVNHFRLRSGPGDRNIS